MSNLLLMSEIASLLFLDIDHEAHSELNAAASVAASVPAPVAAAVPSISEEHEAEEANVELPIEDEEVQGRETSDHTENPQTSSNTETQQKQGYGNLVGRYIETPYFVNMSLMSHK